MTLNKSSTPPLKTGLFDISPEAAIDYLKFNRMNSRTQITGEWLSFCPAVS